MNSYEDHLRAELARLKGETAVMQRSLDMFLQWKATNQREATPTLPLNGGGKPPEMETVLTGISSRSPVNKSAFLTSQIKGAAQLGVSTQDLYKAAEDNGINMSRDHIRSVLWHGVHEGKFVKRDDGKYIIKSEEPNA